jgi:hypothetical protein
LSLPKGLTSIGNFAFNGCSGLTSITAYNPVPVPFGGADGVWGDVNYAACTLYVANSSVEAYKNATLWESFWGEAYSNIRGAGFIVTAEPNGAGLGTVTGLVENKFYQTNDTVKLTATKLGEFLFKNWTSKGVEISTDATLNLTITQDTAVVANFVKEHSGVVTAGELHNVPDIKTTSKITLRTGSTLDARDFAFMRDSMPYLVDVALDSAAIVAYSGTEGTVSGQQTYPASKIPQQAFNGKALVSATLPSGITSIGEGAFQNTKLSGVEIPAKVNTIEASAFSGSAIAGLTFAASSELTAIGSNAFENCLDLTGLSLPAKLVTIGDYAFSGCTNLTGTLTIPAKVTAIGAYAFAKEDAYNSSSKLSGVVFPNGLLTIGANAFKYSKSLEAISLPESLTGLGEAAFYNCTHLKGTVRIPRNITSIESRVFGSDSIQYLVLHENVTEIKGYAFANNPFDSVRVYGTEPIKLESGANHPFYGVNSSSDKRPLLVPEGSYSAYLNTDIWKEFEFGNESLMSTDNIDYGNRDWRVEATVNNPSWGSVADVSVAQGMPDWIRKANDFDNDEYYYTLGQTVKLKATPKPKCSFTGWTKAGSSDVVSTDTVYSFAVSGKEKLIANFVLDSFTVTIVVADPNMGTATGSGRYVSDTSIEISATPFRDYEFVSWSDGVTADTRTITVTKDTTLTATFKLKETPPTPTPPTGVAATEALNVSIYPNPAVDEVTVVLPDNAGRAVFTLYDVQGRALIRKEISRQGTASVGQLPAGLYIIEVVAGKQSYKGKLIRGGE